MSAPAAKKTQPTKRRRPMKNPQDERDPVKKAKHLVKTAARFRDDTVAQMRGLAREAGGRLLDPSAHSLKKKAKVASKLQKKGVAYEPRDILRFTIVFSRQQYLRGVARAYNLLAQNPKMKTKAAWLKISWGRDDIYKGINTSWIVYTDEKLRQAAGAKRETYTFELQFHTQESLDLKEVIHNAYDYVEYTCKAFPRDKSIQLAMIDGGGLATSAGIKKMEKQVAEAVDGQWHGIAYLIPQRIRRMMGSGTKIQRESCARVYQYMERQATLVPTPRGLTPEVAKMKLPAVAKRFGGGKKKLV